MSDGRGMFVANASTTVNRYSSLFVPRMINVESLSLLVSRKVIFIFRFHGRTRDN